jgi:two-component sensor histidine kinase
MQNIDTLIAASGFLPHGVCLLWRPELLALHAVSDTLIAGAYFSIPLAILAFLRRRTDLVAEHKRIAMLFGVFILGCGLTHVLGVATLWRPIYVVDGLVKAVTAAASVLTAIVLWPMLPRLLQIPSPRQLSAANARLQTEIDAKLAAVEALEAARANLESEVRRRAGEVQALARRFEIATAGSRVTLYEQDASLKYTWLHNPRPPLTEAALGLEEPEAIGPGPAAVLAPLKQQVLETGQPLEEEVRLPLGDDERHFALKITPLIEGDEGHGLLTASVDITEQKRQQEHLQLIMRELAHRAKNLLSLVEGVARQTARAEALPDGFVRRFSARLAALGGAYDLLISHDWRGVELRALIESQLGHLLPEARGRIRIDGPELEVSPEAGQYLALGLHELSTNAAKHGALSQAAANDPSAGVDIRWTIDADRRVELLWVERGPVDGTPERAGFGRLLLETVIPRALRGQAALAFEPGRLTWRVAYQQQLSAPPASPIELNQRD